MNPRSLEKTKILRPICLLSMFASLVFCIVKWAQHTHDAFSVEYMFIQPLVIDVLKDPSQFWNWAQAPNCPGYFPDMFIYIISYLFSRNFYSSMLLYAALQTTLFFLSIHLFFCSLFIERRVALIMSTVAIALFASAMVLPFAHIYTHIFSVGSHFGAFTNSLLSFYIFFRVSAGVTGIRSIAYFLGALVLSSIMVLSDGMYFFYFLFPFALVKTSSLLFGKQKGSAFLYALLAPLSFLLANTLFRKLLMGNTPPFQILLSAESIRLRMPALLHSMADHNNWIGQWLFFVSVGGLIAYPLLTVTVPIKAPDTHLAEERRKLLLAVLTSAISIVAVSVFLLVVDSIGPSARYLLNYYCYPVLLLPPIVRAVFLYYEPFMPIWTRRIDWSLRYVGWAMLSLAVVLFAIPTLHSFAGAEFAYVPFKCIHDAIEESAVKNGVADYLYARPIEIFSEKKINVFAVDNDLNQFVWLINPTKFTARTQLDFAVLRQNSGIYTPGGNALIEINGEPERTVQCRDFKVILYPKKKLYLSKRPLVVEKNKPHLWEACEMSIETPPRTSKCSLKYYPASDGRFVTYNKPFVSFPIGRYRLKVRYRASAAKSDNVGEIHVNGGVGQEPTRSFGSVQLPGTGNSLDEVSLDISIDEDGAQRTQEIKTYFSGLGELELHQFRLERL